MTGSWHPAALAVFLLAGFPSAAFTGSDAASGAVRGDVATPIEILAEIADDGLLRCRPPLARLPATDRVAFHVINRADQAVTFVAPVFFKWADHMESGGFVLDLVPGGFIVAPQSTVRVLLRTPPPGQYSYSCFSPGRIPDPQTSGFIEVVPSAR